MPELPEVETVRRALRPLLVGRRLVRFLGGNVPLRAPIPLARLRREVSGRIVVDVRRRAKYLVVEVDGARALTLHLGMTGSLATVPVGAARGRHDHLRIVLDNGLELRFNDPRRFGEVACHRLAAPGGWPAFLERCGPEPLERDFTGAYLFQATRRRARPLKTLLLESEFVAGVGNIYACESLHRAGLHPARVATDLTREECGRLVSALKLVLRSALRHGGTTVQNYRLLNGDEGRFQRVLRVYDRAGQPCATCGAGRTTSTG